MNKHLLIILIFYVFFLSCSKKDDSPKLYELNETNVELHYDESFQFKITNNGKIVNFSSANTIISNPRIGTIDYAGLFTAETIGESSFEIKVDSHALYGKITVIPYFSDLFAEPFYLNFKNESPSIINSENSAGRVLVHVSDNEEATIFKGENELVHAVLYAKSNDNRNLISGSIVKFRSDYQSAREDLRIFLSERYTQIGKVSVIDGDPQYDAIFFKSEECLILLDRGSIFGMDGMILFYLPNENPSKEEYSNEDIADLYNRFRYTYPRTKMTSTWSSYIYDNPF